MTDFYNQATDNAPLIAHGDYRRYKAALKNGQILVIAYGSNPGPMLEMPVTQEDSTFPIQSR